MFFVDICNVVIQFLVTDELTGETEEVEDENYYNFEDFLEEDIMGPSPFEDDEIDDYT